MVVSETTKWEMVSSRSDEVSLFFPLTFRRIKALERLNIVELSGYNSITTIIINSIINIIGIIKKDTSVKIMPKTTGICSVI
jgi:hypothetical protein